ncbi:MAG: ABC transporter permease [Lactobacillus sp.]|nr:ABC transporter permease [Lactobacillus sp.]MCH3906307.1 ABC transporter permease [Lactobacillus sp.]MCH3990118.1 ABC transporter permease [Lactobacillus sp.]MCH4069168.1 ABC transporter permease [Lactobacillus sp.]MCI1303470.1 ABC transporter permease [Lactobacillus sp.]
MIKYWQENNQMMLSLTWQHLVLVISSLVLATIIAVIIIALFLRKKNWLKALTYFFSLLYSVPSFAFFALLIPLTGLGTTSAIIVLVIYSEYVLLRNFITGIQEVDPSYLEVAKGLGMNERQIFLKVQLPLAMSAIFSGLQIALCSTMAIATIASTISAGGLGDLLFEGLQTGRIEPILWGTILTACLSLYFMLMLKLLENVISGSWRNALKGEN